MFLFAWYGTHNSLASSPEKNRKMHWAKTIHNAALLTPKSLMGTENTSAGSGPARLSGSSFLITNNAGNGPARIRYFDDSTIVNSPFSAMLIATPQYRCPSEAFQ